MTSFGPLRWLLTLAAFLVWLGGVWGWGRFLLGKVGLARPGAGVCLAAGTALASLIMAVLGLAGWLQPTMSPLLIAGLGLGLVAGRMWRWRPWPLPGGGMRLFSRPGLRRLLAEHPGLLLLAGLLLYRFVQASLPDMHPDALWYNLPAARHWLEVGAVRFDPSAVPIATASYWEYLYLWPAVLLGRGEDLASLISFHVFAQWIHFAAGTCAVPLILCSMFPRSRRQQPLLFGLALLAALLARDPYYSGITAKNDWGAAAWFLAGVALILRGPSQPSRLLGWALLGLSGAAKITYLYPVAVFVAVHLLLVRRSGPAPSQAAGPADVSGAERTAGLGILSLPLAVHLVRNFIWTGNPVFPAGGSWFPSPYLSDVWGQAMTAFEGGLPGDLFTVINNLAGFIPPPQLIGLFFLAPLITRRSSVPARERVLVHTALWSALLFSLLAGARAEARLIGAIPVLILFLGTLEAGKLLRRVFPGPRGALAAGLALAAYLLAGAMVSSGLSDPPDPAPRSRMRSRAGLAEARVYNAQSGSSLRHLHGTAVATTRVLSLNETRMYYFLPYGGTRLWDDPELARRVLAARGPEATIDLLLAEGWSHLLITLVSIDSFFHAPTVDSLVELTSRYPRACVVLAPYERLVDLHRLRRAMQEEQAG